MTTTKRYTPSREAITQDTIERFCDFFCEYYKDPEDAWLLAEAMQLCNLASKELARNASE